MLECPLSDHTGQNSTLESQSSSHETTDRVKFENRIYWAFSPKQTEAGQRSLVVYSPWGLKESDKTEWLSRHTRTGRTMRGDEITHCTWLTPNPPFPHSLFLCSYTSAWHKRFVGILFSIDAILQGQKHEHTLTFCSPAHPPGQLSGQHSGGWSQHGSRVSPAAAAAKSLQLSPTLCDPIDGSPPGSPVPGILQARTLEWVSISFSKNKS